MHTITFQQKAHLPRSHEDLTPPSHLEALVPVPVHAYPMAEHFRVCGARHTAQPLPPEQLAVINDAAKRVAVTLEKDGYAVVVDGKYRAGDFKLKHDYSERFEGELRAAECATLTVLKLAEGHQPSDMSLAVK